jgi:hypothetical protein
MRSVCECSCGLDGRGIVVRLTAAERYISRLRVWSPPSLLYREFFPLEGKVAEA